jgi:hypothetical protein
LEKRRAYISGLHVCCHVFHSVPFRPLPDPHVHSIPGMTDRLRQCKPGRSFARSVAEGTAGQLSGFGERVPWSEATRLALVQRLEARCSRIGFIVRCPPPPLLRWLHTCAHVCTSSVHHTLWIVVGLDIVHACCIFVRCVPDRVRPRVAPAHPMLQPCAVRGGARPAAAHVCVRRGDPGPALYPSALPVLAGVLVRDLNTWSVVPPLGASTCGSYRTQAHMWPVAAISSPDRKH